MGFRTVVVKHRSKLDLRTNYLVCRGKDEKRVFIPEISTLILETTSISITTALLSELTKNNVKIILCDEKHNPESEVVSYYGCHNSSKKLQGQIRWTKNIREKIWLKIVQEKIAKQSQFLGELGHRKEAQMLDKYVQEVALNDSTNREGHSAKVYFNAVFGMGFSRRDPLFVNSALNYGYAILLSLFNREVVRNGYLTQLGIWHKNEFNYFNLSCDLMEPFRIIVDRCVYDLKNGEGDFRLKLLDILELKVKIAGKQQLLENAISIYCQSVFDALNNSNEELIRFYEL